MSPERQPNPPLTDEQQSAANTLIEVCELGDVADQTIEMYAGISGTVQYGLGRCFQHMTNMTPDEIRQFVLLKLEQQGS